MSGVVIEVELAGTARRGRGAVWPTGVEVALEVELDAREAERRQVARARPILSLELLRLLLEMPVGSPIGLAALSAYERRLLETAARLGALELAPDEEHATRQAVPPLAVQHATVHGSDWRAALRAASRFAPYTSRTVLLDRLPMDDVELRFEAAYLGVGVSVQDGTGQSVREVVPAAPFTPVRFTAASWLFLERILSTQSAIASDR